jgi:two-component system sensor histidine kinase KdpD
VETHGREHTREQLDGLEVVPRRTVGYRGTELTELNLPAVLARRPEVALVDELAHTNVPGVEHGKRWQDVEALLEAGIDVISTVNVQHLESLNDVVEAITGVPQRETVPDSVVRAAEQVELVDMTPEALRRRMAHGNIYASDKVDAALSNYFRPGNLTALRELALLWLADRVEEGLQRYREQHGIAAPWETRERVVVALSGGPEGETLIRRAARIAARATGGDLLAVHVARSDGLAGSSAAALEKQRLLAESLGGSYHVVSGEGVPEAVLEFARANNATQIVIGASRSNPLLGGLAGGTGRTIIRGSDAIDVHVVTHDYVGRARLLPRLRSGLSWRRRLAGLLLAAVLISGLTALAVLGRPQFSLGSDVLLFLLAVVLVSLVGGFVPALTAAVVGSLALNWFLVPPIHRFTIQQRDNLLTLIVFVLVAALVSRVVDSAARRTAEAARANAEAETLSALAGTLLRGEQRLGALLQRVRETFGAQSVSLLQQETEAPASTGSAVPVPTTAGLRGTWSCVASVGEDPALRPEDGDTEVFAGDDNLLLVLRGRALPAEDQRMLAAFAAQVAVAHEQRRLAAAAAAAGPLAETDRARSALLNAVSHDLRTPLATAKAAVSSLRSRDVVWDDDARTELLASADTALDRLTDLVTNLLDLSRLNAGVLPVTSGPVALDDVVQQALTQVRTGEPGGPDVEVEMPALLPDVLADSGLLERVVANLLDNALRFTPPGRAVRVSASSHGDAVELRVVDRGPGIPEEERDAAFAPFQQRDDRAPRGGAGVGLGLAIARGFTEAMHGALTLEDTPGGGLTAVVALPRAPDRAPLGSPASAGLGCRDGL